jgi:hypothetical protein
MVSQRLDLLNGGDFDAVQKLAQPAPHHLDQNSLIRKPIKLRSTAMTVCALHTSLRQSAKAGAADTPSEARAAAEASHAGGQVGEGGEPTYAGLRTGKPVGNVPILVCIVVPFL